MDVRTTCRLNGAVPGREVETMYLRVLDVLDTLFLRKHPVLPVWRAVRHASQDDLRDLQPRVSETDYDDASKVHPRKTEPEWRDPTYRIAFWVP